MHKLIVPALVAVLATGCSFVYRQPIYQGTLVSPESVEQLQVGMNRQQVSALLGTPSVQDPFHHDRWDYTATERVGRTGGTEVRNLVLFFEGDSWQFSTRSTLIRLFPERFWFDAALAIGLFTVVGVLAAIGIAWGWERQARRRETPPAEPTAS